MSQSDDLLRRVKQRQQAARRALRLSEFPADVSHHGWTRDERPLTDFSFVSVDVETTGHHSKSLQVPVELSAIRFSLDPAVRTRCFHTLVNPGKPVEQHARVPHNLTDEDLADQPTLSEAMTRFDEFVREPDTICLAYNASFDAEVLGFSYLRARRSPPGVPFVDVLKLARDRLDKDRIRSRQMQLGIEGGWGLRPLCAALDLMPVDQVDQEHRAARDAELCKLLFLTIIGTESRFIDRFCDEPVSVARELFLRTNRRHRNSLHWLTDASYATSVPTGFKPILDAVNQRRLIRLLVKGDQPVGERTFEVIPLWFSDPNRVRKGQSQLFVFALADGSGEECELDVDEIEHCEPLDGSPSSV
jgi:DNA polymerase III epsilon subunit-like protein